MGCLGIYEQNYQQGFAKVSRPSVVALYTSKTNHQITNLLSNWRL